MKRVGLILMCLSLMVCLSGCDKKEEASGHKKDEVQNKVLECSSKSDGMSFTYAFSFAPDDKLSSAAATITYTATAEELKETSLSEAKKSLEKEFAETFDKEKYKITDNGKDTITITLEFSNEQVKELIEGEDVKLESVKKSLEEHELTCSVK